VSAFSYESVFVRTTRRFRNGSTTRCSICKQVRHGLKGSYVLTVSFYFLLHDDNCQHTIILTPEVGEHLTDLDCIVGADLCLFTRWGCVINKCSSARACVCFSNHETRKPLNFVL